MCVACKFTRALIFRNRSYEAHEASPAKKLCNKNGSMSLGIRTVNPLKARTEYACLTAPFTQDAAAIATHFQTIPLSNYFV